MGFLQPSNFCIFRKITFGYMLHYFRYILFILTLVFLNLNCGNRADNAQPTYLSMQMAKEKGLFLAAYSIKNKEKNNHAVKSAYSYLPFKKRKASISQQVLLLKTDINIEGEAKFFALDSKGKTGRIFSTDSTYMIVIEDTTLLNRQNLTLYEFAVEKPDEKYLLTLKDSLVLESYTPPHSNTFP
jgi:hypothetical protein